ncbi:MAG TPA: hypothetical protein ENK83_05420 [Aliiroseovarius sp.]|nr:hypothetical protein [Aliiroseovarius sp.]
MLDFSTPAFIATSAAMAIDELLLGLYEQDIVAVMSGLSGDAQRTLSTLEAAGRLPKANQVATLGKAIERAAELLG